MKSNEIEEDIRSIKILMERSSKFISLSGLSGITAGLYALLGAYLAGKVMYGNSPYWGGFDLSYDAVSELVAIALGVLILAIGTCILLSARKAKQKGQQFWNPTSRSLLLNMAIPLFTGGVFILIIVYRGYFSLLVPVCLIFYGLALIAGSHYTYGDIKWLGAFEILLGLAAAFWPGFGLLFWVAGFGLFQILYGSIMYFKYDR